MHPKKQKKNLDRFIPSRVASNLNNIFLDEDKMQQINSNYDLNS